MFWMQRQTLRRLQWDRSHWSFVLPSAVWGSDVASAASVCKSSHSPHSWCSSTLLRLLLPAGDKTPGLEIQWNKNVVWSYELWPCNRETTGCCWADAPGVRTSSQRSALKDPVMSAASQGPASVLSQASKLSLLTLCAVSARFIFNDRRVSGPRTNLETCEAESGGATELLLWAEDSA